MWPFLLIVLELAVCFPRLLGLFPPSSDAEQYTLLGEFFRGGSVADLRAPFAYRVLEPLIASFLPWEIGRSMVAINMLAFAGAVVAIDQIVVLRHGSERERLVAALLSIVSFPACYYVALGTVDALALFFLAVGTWAILTGQTWVASFVVLLGALTKESTVILLAVALAYRSESFWPSLVFFLIGQGIARTLVGLPPWFFWEPSLTRVLWNVGRWHAWIAIPMSFGLPAVLAAVFLWASDRKLERDDHALLVGAGSAIALTLFALIATTADGRSAWMMTPFAIPLVFRT